MEKKLLLFTLLMVSGLCGPAISQEYGKALIEHGMFDKDLSGWQRVYGSPAWDGEVGHDTAGCLRIEGPGSMTTDFIPFAGEFVRVTAWMKTKDVVRGEQPWHKATVQVIYYDKDKKSLGHFDPGSAQETTDWTQYESIFFWEKQRGVAFFKIGLMNWNCQGTSWFDDVEVVTAPPTKAWEIAPPRDQMENNPPLTWPQPQVGPEQTALQTDVLRLDLEDGFELSRVDGGGIGVTDFVYREPGVESDLERYPPRLQIDRGYMTRLVLAGQPDGPPKPDTAEGYVETFRGSPILDTFIRSWLGNGAEGNQLDAAVLVAADDAQLWGFQGNKLVQCDDGRLVLDQATTKPFAVLRKPDDSGGLVIYHPIPAEVRRWYVEDYIVEAELAVRLELASGQLHYSSDEFGTSEAGYIHSLDFYFSFMPYEGPLAEAMKQLAATDIDLMQDVSPLNGNPPRGYWEPHMSLASGQRLLRMARYFPREFTSWMKSDGWAYGHEGGRGWGCTTATMKGIRVGPLAEAALQRNHALRMLTFFVEYGGPQGAPWMCYTWRAEAGRVGSLKLHHQSVFCQYWEWRLGEFLALLRDPGLLSQQEKLRLFRDLDRARYVFDPDGPGTWTRLQPNGGYWFNYIDQPPGRQTRYVINSHTTSVGNVGHLAMLARVMGQTEAEAYWTKMFEKGIDGLLYAMGEPWMWQEWDENEVAYAGAGGGKRGYSLYMVSSWMPTVLKVNVELGVEHRLDELVAMQKRMMKAEYTIANERFVNLGQECLDWVQENRRQ